MTARGPSRSISCLSQLSPLRPARQDPPVRSSWIGSGAVERRYSTVDSRPNLRALEEAFRSASAQKASPQWPPRQSTNLPPLLYSVPTYLDDLLLGIRRRDGALTTKSFLAWTDVLADDAHPDHQFVAKQFNALPTPVVSEIIRNMDPIEHPELDVAHGLRVNQGSTHFTDLGKLMNSNGIRNHHQEVLEGMKALMYASQGKRALLPEDFTVFLRCAGAALDYLFAAKIFSAMIGAGLRNERNAKTWKEFLRARFVLHPTFYQYDRARIAFNPRDLVTHQDKINGRGEVLQKMDQVRFSEALFSRDPWNRQLRPQGYYVDMRQILSRRAQSTSDMYFYHSRSRKVQQLKAYKSHFGKMFRAKMRKFARRRSKWRKGPNLWSRRVKRLRRMKFGIWGRGGRPGGLKPDARKLRRRRRARNKIIQRFFKRINGPPRDPPQSFWRTYVKSITRPNVVDEELICLFIQGFARSNDIRAILSLILRKYYYVEVSAKYGSVRGGKYFPNRSIQRPTSRLLETIVEAFGSMSQISLGMQLVDHFSQRYNIKVPPAVWSNLLNWSFFAASKTNQNLRRIYGDGDSSKINVDDVVKIWEVMTSPPYNIKPSFEDLDVYIKALIITRQFEKAVEVIRSSAVPYFDTLSSELKNALFDEILLKDAIIDPSQHNSSTISIAVQRRQLAETRKDYVRNRICCYFDDLLREASRDRNSRHNGTTTELIPSLVAEFPHFFQSGIRYRISTGYVHLHAPDNGNINYSHSELQMRTSLASGVSSASVKETAVDANGVPWKKQNTQGLVYRDKRGRMIKNKKFIWPTKGNLPILEKKRVPRQRFDGKLKAPSKTAGDQKLWWERLRLQLMM